MTRRPEDEGRQSAVDEHPFVVASINLRNALQREPRSPIFEPIFAEWDRELRTLLAEDPKPREAGEEHPLYRKDGAPNSDLAGQHYDTVQTEQTEQNKPEEPKQPEGPEAPAESPKVPSPNPTPSASPSPSPSPSPSTPTGTDAK